MTNNHSRLRELFRLYTDNLLSPQQETEFWTLLSGADPDALDDELSGLWHQTREEQSIIPNEVWDRKMAALKELLRNKGEEKPPEKKAILLARYWWAAAAILLALTATMYFVLSSKRGDGLAQHEAETTKSIADITPGSDKAVLTLADGTRVILDSALNGVVGQQGSTTVFKKDGQLIYSSEKIKPAEIAYNMLSIPRGGQYQLTLSDGTRIWLNSASTLLYPTVFAGKDRQVTITGEAYFEVAKDPARRFLVNINGSNDQQQMTVEVLGTHFNINAYQDEELVKTTLLEGSIKLNTPHNSHLLKPGQQAQVNIAGNTRLVSNADLEETIAWKEGNFQFEDASIESVMRQLSRWYDIEVEYKGKINKHFGGTISRNVNLSKVLHLLEQTGEVKFSIEGNKVLVAP